MGLADLTICARKIEGDDFSERLIAELVRVENEFRVEIVVIIVRLMDAGYATTDAV